MSKPTSPFHAFYLENVPPLWHGQESPECTSTKSVALCPKELSNQCPFNHGERCIGQEKQAKLLAFETGHFSMIRFGFLACLSCALLNSSQTEPRPFQSSPPRRPNHRIEWLVVRPFTHKVIRAAYPHASSPIIPLIHIRRLLRLHVHPLLHALLPRPARLFWHHVGCAGIHAIRTFLRLHGRQGCPVEGQEQFNGTRIRLFGRSGT